MSVQSILRTCGWLMAVTIFLTSASVRGADPLPALMKSLASHEVTIVDLTYSLDENNPYWPEGRTQTPFKAKVAGTYERNGLFARELEIPEHYGTHIDAPLHFDPHGWKVGAIPYDRLVASAIVIDVEQEAKTQAEYRVTEQDIKNWERAHGALPAGGIAFFRTGWGKRWPSESGFMQPDAGGHPHFPCLTVEAGRYLMTQMRPVGIGIDSPGIDLGDDHTYPLHHLTLDAHTYLLENVGNLEALPAAGAVVIVSPMKLAGGSGSPVRILALVPMDNVRHPTSGF